jgi:nucleotide-binding universal stress UspA family protein
MGSVSDAVLRQAHCSVELVRTPNLLAHKPGDTTSSQELKRVLLAVDASTFSEAACRMLIEQVQPETEVQVLNVVQPMNVLTAREMGDYSFVERIYADETKQARVLVDAIAARLREKRVSLITEVAQGDPKSEILDASETWKADLIVVGSHGRTGLERFLLGSMSEVVGRHARCSVEVVRIAVASA